MYDQHHHIVLVTDFDEIWHGDAVLPSSFARRLCLPIKAVSLAIFVEEPGRALAALACDRGRVVPSRDRAPVRLHGLPAIADIGLRSARCCRCDVQSPTIACVRSGGSDKRPN